MIAVMTHHHPSEDHLVHYAAGIMPQGMSMLVAAHLNYCADCRGIVREAEAVGGALIDHESLVPEPMLQSHPDFDRALADEPRSLPAVDVPSPLRPFIGTRLADVRWRTFWPGMQTVRIPCADDPSDISLLRLKPGTGMPVHTHGGEELTLVLKGSYTDETGRFSVGDVALGDPNLTHRPVADAGVHCVCFTVVSAPLKFASPLARLASRLLLR
jgi:putative transcriptional regulator